MSLIQITRFIVGFWRRSVELLVLNRYFYRKKNITLLRGINERRTRVLFDELNRPNE